MHVVALAVQLDLEVGADLGEDSSECFDSLAIKAAVAAFGDKDQMNVHCRSAMPAVPKVLDFVHGPDNNESMEPLGVVVGARLRVVHNTQELKLKLLNFGQDERSRGRPAWEAKAFAKRGAKDFRLAGNRCSDKLST